MLEEEFYEGWPKLAIVMHARDGHVRYLDATSTCQSEPVDGLMVIHCEGLGIVYIIYMLISAFVP